MIERWSPSSADSASSLLCRVADPNTMSSPSDLFDPQATRDSAGGGPASAAGARRSGGTKSGSGQTGVWEKPLSPTGPSAGGSVENLIVRRNSKDQLDNIKGLADGAGQRRSSSSSSIRSRRCSGDSVRQIVQLASIKESINSNNCSQQELESLISAKLSQCRVLFDFLDDPLSDLKYKVSACASSDSLSDSSLPHETRAGSKTSGAA